MLGLSIREIVVLSLSKDHFGCTVSEVIVPERRCLPTRLSADRGGPGWYFTALRTTLV